MKRKQKKYSKPRNPFDRARIEEENGLREKYGLKNKKEIWKADAFIGRIRNLAKQLITKSEEEKKGFIQRLQKKGFQVENLADALGLNKEDWLKRRLQTIVFMKKITNTPKQARQFVTHKHVSIGDKIVNIPSYMVSLEEEPLIRLNIVLKTPGKKEKIKKIEPEADKKEIEIKGDKEVKPEIKKIEEKVEIPEKVESPEKTEIIEKPIEVKA